MGWGDLEPSTAPTRPPSLFRIFGRSGASTSRDIDDRPFCINRSTPQSRVRREMSDDSDEEERIQRLRQPKENNFPRCGTAKIIQEEFDKEESEKYPVGKISPPMLTRKSFNIKREQEIIPIGELWDEERRGERAKRILIIIRGPPLCGKSYLSRKIEQKELAFSEHNKVRIINGLDSKGMPKHREFSDKFTKAIFDGMKFIISEMKFLRSGSDMISDCIRKGEEANYQVFGIDLFVDTDHQLFLNQSCKIHSRFDYGKNVRGYLKKMEQFPMPSDVTLLDPFEIYEIDYKIQFLLANQKEKENFEITNACDEDHEIIREFAKRILEDQKISSRFPPGILNSVNFQQEIVEIFGNLLQHHAEKFNKSTTQLYLDKIDDFKVKNVINYNHKHLKTFEEEASEFKIQKVYDYRHRKNNYLDEILEDVDIDEIMDKNKEDKKEKKKLWYVGKAKNEEEIESNKKYPKNWEKIEVEREKPIGKRKKKKTAKIKRVLDYLTSKAVNTVRKRVKRLNLNEEPLIVSPMDFEPIPQDIHIRQLLNSTILSNIDDDTKSEYLDYIKSFYRRLDEIEEMNFILRLIVQADKIEIFFHFDESFPPFFCDSRKILIDVRSKTENEIISSLAHQMMHLAMSMTYGNDGNPHRHDDEDRKDEIVRILFEIECRGENHAKFIEMLRDDESRWNFEVMGCCAEIIAMGEKEKLIKNYENLWKFYERSLKDVEKFFRQFEDCSRLSCFSPI